MTPTLQITEKYINMSEMSIPFAYNLFNLEPRDLKVYESMLSENGGLSIRSLAEKVQMNRGTVFEVIKKLVKLGVVTSHYRLSRKYYVAQSPDVFQKFAEERASLVTQEMGRVKEYVSGLQKIQVNESQGRFSQLYEGDDEIALLLHDVLDTVADLPDKTYRVISSAELRNHLYKKFENFTRQRIKRGITARVIGNGESDVLAPLAERKWLTSDETPACYILIYGTKVAQISLSQNGNVQGSVINNSGVAQLHTLLFEKLWSFL